jgi:hypothetical protein
LSRISDFIFEANKEIFRNIFDIKCKEYEQEFIKKIEIIEDNVLSGIIIYFDWEGVRYLLEGHYLGKDKFKFTKYWRKIFRDEKVHTFKATIQKVNTKMLKFYKKMNFKIIAEDDFNFCLEYRRQQ